MAQPITSPVAKMPAPAEYAEAIHSGLELLQLMHERGILDLLRGLIGAGNQAVETAAQAMDAPDTIRALRNFILLTKFFASIPPDVLNSLVQTAAEGAEREKSGKAPSLLQLYRRATDQDSRHAIAVILDLAQAVGKGL